MSKKTDNKMNHDGLTIWEKLVVIKNNVKETLWVKVPPKKD